MTGDPRSGGPQISSAHPARTIRHSRPGLARQPLCAVLLTATCAALALWLSLVPTSKAAYTAKIENVANQATTAAYFTCAAAVAANTPGIWYRLDESSGTTATDSSANARNGTYRGSYTLAAAPACVRDSGSAVTFDGSTGYVGYTSAFTVSGTFTIELWFKTTSTRGGWLAGFGSAATGASPTVDRLLYLTDSGKVVLGINPSAPRTVVSPASYNNGSWHHVMGTASASGLTLYIDGVSVATSTATVSTASFSGYFRIGYDALGTSWTNAPTSSFLAGTIDDAAAYGRTLTATDALNHHRAGT